MAGLSQTSGTKVYIAFLNTSSSVADTAKTQLHHRCDLAQHDFMIDSQRLEPLPSTSKIGYPWSSYNNVLGPRPIVDVPKDESSSSINPGFPDCAHCRRDWTELLRPKWGTHISLMVYEKDRMSAEDMSKKVAFRMLEEARLRAAISHFSDVPMPDPPVTQGILQRVISASSKDRLTQKRGKMLGLLEEFYSALFVESCMHFRRNPPHKKGTMLSRVLHIGIGNDQAYRHMHVKKLEYFRILETVESIFSTGVNINDWNEASMVYREIERVHAYNCECCRGIRFLHQSKALVRFKEGLRALRRPILDMNAEGIE